MGGLEGGRRAAGGAGGLAGGRAGGWVGAWRGRAGTGGVVQIPPADTQDVWRPAAARCLTYDPETPIKHTGEQSESPEIRIYGELK